MFIESIDPSYYRTERGRGMYCSRKTRRSGTRINKNLQTRLVKYVSRS